MDQLPSQEEDMPMPIPINSTYGHGHGHGHTNHIMTSSSLPPPPSMNGPTIEAGAVVVPAAEHDVPFKKMVIRYRECLKNHAASMGGNAIDGCGEFMPSGEEGSIEALTCSACNCHRNFHRKEIEGGEFLQHLNRVGRKFYVGHNHKSLLGHDHQSFGGYTTRTSVVPNQMIMSYNCESEDQENGGVGGVMSMARPIHYHHHNNQMVKKRHRTKFSQEQKEKMLNFAEKVGWKMQKTEEAVVQQFCQEIGVKRRVLKVWMHNNKHHLAKKNSNDHPQNIQV